MAELAGVFAASHGPLIARDWDALPESLRTRMTVAFRDLGKRFAAKKLDVLIVLSPDHWVNFFLNNLPNVCIGVGVEHEGPPEPFMKAFARKIPGDADFGAHLLATALKSEFEPSLSHHLTLDHGFCLPLMKMELDSLPRIVPIAINDIEPPMISIKRALAWGRLLREAIAFYPKNVRIGILATGGLSHSIGEPTMGVIDEAFDRECIERFTRGGNPETFASFLEAALADTGNGAQEVRNWAITHAAAGFHGFDMIDYIPAKEVYIGCCWAEWKLAA
jgi:aromatic ring-opening dioxygenase catalytic subunit (LigB family)